MSPRPSKEPRSSIGSWRPTRIYVKPLLELMAEIAVHGLAHITGGGLVDNVPRVLPEGLEAVLERRAWTRDPVFDWLQSAGPRRRRGNVPRVQLRHRHDRAGRRRRCATAPSPC